MAVDDDGGVPAVEKRTAPDFGAFELDEVAVEVELLGVGTDADQGRSGLCGAVVVELLVAVGVENRGEDRIRSLSRGRSLARASSRASISRASLPSTSPAWMLAIAKTTSFLRADGLLEGVDTGGSARMRRGRSAPPG